MALVFDQEIVETLENRGSPAFVLPGSHSPRGKSEEVDIMSSKKIVIVVVLIGVWTVGTAFAQIHSQKQQVEKGEGILVFETVELHEGGPPAKLHIACQLDTVDKHPVILMLGSLNSSQLPGWSADLVSEGYMLVAFSVAHPPDPDVSRRPQWLFFDQRFAHSYALGGHRAPTDAARVIDYLISRGDVHPKKIGWMGSSSTGIPGLSVAVVEPRLAAIVAFVSTGAYREWFKTWFINDLWQGDTDELWPETEQLLEEYDPILKVQGMYPTATLMVSGGADKVVDPTSARAFYSAAQPYYEQNPERLRLVVYEGFGHNLPLDVVKMYTENWFRLYMHPQKECPSPSVAPEHLEESVVQTQINEADHKDVIGAQ